MSTSKSPKRPFTAVMLALAAGAACVIPLAAGQGGPMPKPVVDAAAANRGRAVYAQHCINCHGSSAKGSEKGPDLIRSTVVLRDRAGNGIGPAIRKSATHQAELTDAQVVELSHFLRQRIDAIVSNRNPRGPINVLTGNPEAGRAYFNGGGTCSSCHSPTGDFAGLATRISDPMTLQQRFLFPSLRRGGPKQVEVTVTPAGGGRAIEGVLVRIDDFFVSLRDASGEYQTIARAPGVNVQIRDPLARHQELLDTYTDTDMHNVVAYLATLK